MTVIDQAYQLLLDVKEKKYSFSYALNKKIGTLNMDSMDMVIVKDTLKSVINRYYFLKYEISSLVENQDSKEADVLVVSLAMARYARNVVVKDVIDFLSKSNEENNYAFDISKVEELFNSIAKNPTAIPEKYEKNFVKKVALLYSYPEWIVGMMKKHFGTKNTFKTISSSRKSAPINICINELRLDKGDELGDAFQKTDIASTSYEYVAKNPIVDNPLFKQKKVFVMDQMEQLLCDELEIEQGDDVLIIGGSHSHLTNLIAMKAFDLAKINYATESEDIYLSANKMTNQFGIKSAKSFVSTLDLVCTHMAYDKSDKVLVTPPNSELGLIRQRPEILITFKQNELDGLIENQKKYIVEASKFVKPEGILVYSVPTLNIKESFNIVNDFIATNEEFELLEENLIFPYVNKTNGMYYAKLRRKGVEE